MEGLPSTGLPRLARRPNARVDKDELPDKCCKLKFCKISMLESTKMSYQINAVN